MSIDSVAIRIVAVIIMIAQNIPCNILHRIVVIILASRLFILFLAAKYQCSMHDDTTKTRNTKHQCAVRDKRGRQ